jgi:integrase/recombinase XerD
VNRSSPVLSARDASLSISKSIDGFLNFKTAEGLSQNTIASYEYMLNPWLIYIGDGDVAKVMKSDLSGYMAWLRTEYKLVKFKIIPNCVFCHANQLSNLGMR